MGDKLARKNNQLGKFFFKLGKVIALIRLSYLEGLHSYHVRIRKLHDYTYKRGGVYKKWTDNTYSSAVHKTIVAGFIFSFVASSLLQGLFPFLNPVNPGIVQAGSHSVTWSSYNDFFDNSATGTNHVAETTKSNIILNGSGVPDDEGAGSLNINNFPIETVVVGTQEWMANNLNVGTMLASDSIIPTNNGVVEKWCNGNNPVNCETYGGLYHWKEMTNYIGFPSTPVGAQGICPNDFHVPTDSEWYVLENYLSTGTCNAGRTGQDCDPAGTDLKVGGSSGFDALLGGLRWGGGGYGAPGATGAFWTSSYETTNGWRRLVSSTSTMVERSKYTMNSAGLSVRCIANAGYVAPVTPTLSSLKIDSQNSGTDWSTVSWNSESLPANTEIKVNARTSADNSSWSAWSSDYIQNSATSTSGNGSLSSLSNSRWLELQVTLTSNDGVGNPTLTDITVDYNNIDAPTNPAQYRADSSEIADGEWGSGKTSLRADVVTAAENPSTLTPEIEMNTTGSFSGTAGTPTGVAYSPADISYSGSPISDATLGTVSGMTEGETYYWKVRYTDGAGRVSPWSTTSSSFNFEQTPPTVSTFTVNSDNEYASDTSVTLNISASDDGGSGLAEMQFSNNGTDWGATTNADGTIATSGWATYATTHSWDLLAGVDGNRNIYARFKDNAGNDTTGFNYIENFMTTTYKDVGNTTSIWNSKASLSKEVSWTPISYNWLPVDVGGMASPAFADIDNDGDSDLVVGDETGYVEYFRNDGDSTTPSWTHVSNNWLGVDVGDYASPTFADVDNDGDYDLAVGDLAGYVEYFENTGTSSSPTWSHISNNWLGMDIGQFAAPYFVDIDNDSDYDLGIGDNTDSRVAYLRNDGTPTSPTYTLITNSWYAVDEITPAPAFADVDLDGDYDSIVGDYFDDVHYIRNDGDQNTYSWVVVTHNLLPSNVQDYAKPAFADIDGDGDQDLFIGDELGYVEYFQNSLGFTSPATAQSLALDSTSETIVRATLNATESLNGQTITYEMTADGTNWESVSNGVEHNFTNTGSDLMWRATLNGTAEITPEITNIEIDYFADPATDSITLDTQPPSDIANLKAYTNNTKASELSADTWYPEASPYFEWDVNVDSDFNHYEYCFDTSASCTPDQTTANNFWDTSPDISFEGTHYMRVVAVDNAGQQSSSVATFIYKFDENAPGAVTGLGATQTELTKIQVTWNSYIDGASPVDNYKLERVKDSGNEYQIGDDWTAEEGYAVFTFTDNTPFDDKLGSPVQGQTSIEASVKYQYRISVKDVSNSGYSIYQAIKVYGMTNDLRDPDPVTTVLAEACDGTTDNIVGTSIPKCSNVGNIGFEVAVTWNPTSDTGSGVDGYNIYRSLTAAIDSYEIVGTVGNLTNFYYDNDTNNDAGGTDRLNDYTNYYYRITAFDASQNANETDLIPVGTDNSANASTPDVTSPEVPTNVEASPLGIDPYDPTILPDDPEPRTEAIYHQRVQVTWDESDDLKARNSEDGSGIKEDGEGIIGYRLYRSTELEGTYTDVTDNEYVTCDLGARSCFNDQLQSYPAIYYYKVKAIDNYDNESAQSEADDVQTARSNVPTPPTEVRVNTAEGDPATNDDVGHVNVITFKGSNAKDCANDIGCLVKYELWRSETNHASSDDWIDPTKSTKIQEFTPVVTGDDRDTSYEYDDTDLSSATTYYYKVRALDNTPDVPDGGPFYSPLSTITVGTLHFGWDTTADDVAPALPSNLKVKDIHGDGSNYLRNIITWERIEDPDRNGTNDFKEYRLYRSNDGLTFEQVCVDGNGYTYMQSACDATYTNPLTNDDQELAMATNYYMDLIPVATSNQYFYYYITATDNAGTDFKYVTDTQEVINDYSNESAPTIDGEGNIVAVSLNPYIAKPTILDVSGGDYDGLKAELSSVEVSSAIITWTTDQSADSLVEYRKSGTSDPFIAVGNRDMLINHSVRIFDLEPNTEYEYRVISRNYLANNAIAENNELPTLKTSNFGITMGKLNATTSTVEINWSTNIDAKSNFVEWQLQTQPGDDPQSGISGELGDDDPKNHKVVIKGLRSGRKYTYKIKSISNDDFLAENPKEGFLEFSTRSFDSAQFVIEPSSSNIAERNISATSAQIVWETGMSATSWVDYGTKSGQYDYSAGDDILTKTHVVKIENLLSGQTYYYRVRVKDANEVEYVSREYSFRAIAKPEISDITINEIDPYYVVIAWKTNVETDTLLNWGTTTAYGERVGKADSTRHHEIKVENLIDDTEYHYQIVARDEYGNEVVDADKVVRTPLDKEGPKVENVKIDILPLGEDAETASVIISWTTNKPSSKQVQYDEGVVGGNYSYSTTKDETLNNSHTVIIKDLLVSTTYHFRIVAADKRGNETKTNDYTFVTPSAEKSIWQLIVKSIEDTFSWVSNVGSFFTGRE